MKKFVVFTIALLLLALVAVPANAELYPACGIVVSLDYETDEVVFEDFVGFQWAFFGIEDWFVGDIVAAIMDDNNTETVFDDVIISVRYCGYI